MRLQYRFFHNSHLGDQHFSLWKCRNPMRVGSVNNDIIMVSKSNMDTVTFPLNVRSTTTSFGLSFEVSIFLSRSFRNEDLGLREWDEKLRHWSYKWLLITVIMLLWSLRSVQWWERMLSRSSWNWQCRGIGPFRSNANLDSFVGTNDVLTMGAWYDGES